MKTFSRIVSALAVTGSVVLPFAAFAQAPSISATVNTANVVTGVVNSSTSVSVKGTFSLTTAKQRADAEITRRINNLNSLAARISSMKLVSASEKASLQTSITSQVSALTSLEATINAETVVANIKTDIQSITKDYRIYMLVLPQGRIAAAADRVMTIVSDMQALSPKLQARISGAQSASKDMTAANSAYADMQTQITNANSLAQAAVSETANLQPDQGNATVQASNTTALKDADAKLKSAAADLKTARADIQTILNAVKGTGTVTASSSASVH